MVINVPRTGAVFDSVIWVVFISVERSETFNSFLIFFLLPPDHDHDIPLGNIEASMLVQTSEGTNRFRRGSPTWCDQCNALV